MVLGQRVEEKVRISGRPEVGIFTNVKLPFQEKYKPKLKTKNDQKQIPQIVIVSNDGGLKNYCNISIYAELSKYFKPENFIQRILPTKINFHDHISGLSTYYRRI